MFETPVSHLAAEATVSRASHLTWARNLLDAEELATAAHWADLHAVIETSSALPGAEQLIQFGGDGTPAMAEFATLELAAAIGVSDYAARMLISDALDLRHRMPMLWSRVQAGEVKAWAARRIAQTTRPLDRDAAGHVDRIIAPYADRKSPHDLVKIAEAESLRADPELARQRTDDAQRDRGVWVCGEPESGVSALFIKADAVDVARFDQAVGEVATDLAELGDTSSRDERRAKAVGVLASPQLALDLHAEATGRTPKLASGGFPQTVLYVHLTDEALATGQGVARVEGIGPVLVDQVKGWLRHDKVTVTPVLDLPNLAPVDAYEIPDRLREAVHLAMPTDMTPYGTAGAWSKDIDHTIPHRPQGPPGQTGIGNLAPLNRKAHRIKTHGNWQVRQPFPGILIWRSPHGRHYLVDNTGTRPITTAA